MNKQGKVIKDYTVSCIKYLGNGKHSDIFMNVVFSKDSIIYYNNENGVYYVSDTKEHLRHKSYYNTYVEEMNESEFENHFIKINN